MARSGHSQEDAAPNPRHAPPHIVLPSTLKTSLAKGHPWIYRDHLPTQTSFPAGTWVRVSCDGFSAIGIFDPSSPIAIRIFSDNHVPSEPWLVQRVTRAWRRRTPLLRGGHTNAYRLLNGEGDALPGIVVDVYGSHAVLRLDSPALSPLVPWLAKAVTSITGASGISQRQKEGLFTLLGDPPPEQLVVSEHGLRFHADLAVGQKTGLFLDHRENRRRLEPWCQGSTVLNLFSYTGGFSLYAARGGATRVVSVDRAPEAMARCRDNVELNGLDPEVFEFIVGDAVKTLEQLAQRGETFDVVICDPPSLARNRTQRKRALRAYERLHGLCLAVLAPGGLYAAASCTTQIDVETFRDSIATAASRRRRPLQIVLEAGQALDHPMMVGHPEGRYLKFFALRGID